MPCETLQIVGTVRVRAGLSGKVRSLHSSGLVRSARSIGGTVEPVELQATVDRTTPLTGRCRQP